MSKRTGLVLRTLRILMVITLLASFLVGALPGASAAPRPNDVLVDSVKIVSPTTGSPAYVNTTGTAANVTYQVQVSRDGAGQVSFDLIKSGVTTSVSIDNTSWYTVTVPPNNQTDFPMDIPGTLGDGKYDVRVGARQGLGWAWNYTTTLQSVVVDKVLPVATVAGSTAWANFSGSVPFSGTASEPNGNTGSGIASVQVKLDSVGVAGSWVGPAALTPPAVVSATNWISATPSLTEGGYYTVTARANDAAGNVGLSTPYAFRSDATIPTVSISTTGTVTESFSTVSGWSADPNGANASGMKKVTIQILAGGQYWNGSVFTTTVSWLDATGTAPWSYNASAIPFVDGTVYTVNANSVDHANNTSTLATTTFTYDVAPKITIGTIPDCLGIGTFTVVTGTIQDAGPYANNVTVTLQIIASDGKYMDASGVFTTTVVTITVGSYANPNGVWSFGGVNGKQFPQGAVTVKAWAKDTYVRTTMAAQRTFNYDATGPTAVVTSIPSPSRPVLLSGTSSDACSGVFAVSVAILDNLGKYWNGSAFASTTIVSIPVTSLAVGGAWTLDVPAFVLNNTYTVTAFAMDVAGNWGAYSAPVVFMYAGSTQSNLALRTGWNLISLPLIPDNSAIASVLTTLGANVLQVQAYNQAWPSLWKSWNKVTGGDLTTMVDGQGYWVEMAAAGTMTYLGKEMPLPPAVPPRYLVYTGWNQIGFKSVTPKGRDAYLASGIGGANVQVMYGYDAVAGIYVTVMGGDALTPGSGYWMASLANGFIYP